MRPDPLVSVIISSYNYARFLPEAIDSALAQTYPNVEVIVVDDASTDESPRIIAGYGKRIIAHLRSKNQGGRSTYNAACALSRGEIILFLDSDDVLLPTALEKAVPFFRDDPEVVKVHWPLREIDAASRRTGRVIPATPLPEGSLRDLILRDGPDAYESPPATGNAFSRRFLQRVLPVPSGIHCDSYTATLAAVYGTLRTIPEPQGCYRIHGGNEYACLAEDEKNRQLLATYDGRCAALSERLRGMGLDVDPGTWKEGNPRYQWLLTQHRASEELKALIPEDAAFILVDAGQWGDRWGGSEPIAGRRSFPFLEHEGRYWGPPPDDAAAIAEFERLRGLGAGFLVFAWPAFWWMEHYEGLNKHLRSRFPCRLDNERIVVFDLRRQRAAQP